MNQLHKIDNINNDFLQRCFFSQLWIYKCDWWKEAMKEVLLSVLMIFLRLLLSLNSWPWLKNYVCNNIYD